MYEENTLVIDLYNDYKDGDQILYMTYAEIDVAAKFGGSNA